MPLVYYKDNKNLDKPLLYTHKNEVEYTENCVFINGNWFVKEIDVIKKDGKWVRVPVIIFDYTLQKEVEKTDQHYGIVAIDAKGAITEGFYTVNPYIACEVFIGGTSHNCMDYKLLAEDLFIEDLSAGVYFFAKDLTPAVKRQMASKRKTKNVRNNCYNIEENKTYQKSIDLYNNSAIPVDKDLKYLSRYLQNLTFGLELETINGYLPQHVLNQYGIAICKDGSIKDADAFYPPEYVTVPLSGAKGLQVARDIGPIIAKRSEINIQCSYHLHLGGFTIDRIFLVSLYRLCQKIQKDVLKMFPLYKVQWQQFKEKNYCQKLPVITNTFDGKHFNKYINDSFADIYCWINAGRKLSMANNRANKANPFGGNKWDIPTRYYWVNFVNPIIGKRDTIEFRLHTPTLNPDKIINWLLMCNAIVSYARTNILTCIDASPITFTDVLNWYGEQYKTPAAKKLSSNLIAYYQNRVEYFAADAARKDVLSAQELLDDSDFKFNTTLIY